MRKKWTAVYCLVICMALVLTACAPKLKAPGEDLASSSSGGNASNASAASEPVDEIAGLTVKEGVVLYEGNGLTVTLTDFEDVGSYYFIDYKVENSASAARGFTLNNATVNGLTVPSFGSAGAIDPGESYDGEISVETDSLKFAGISKVGSIQLMLSVEDENYNVITEYEPVPVYMEDVSLVCDPAPSSDVIYDKDGALITFQGNYASEDGNRTMFFLVRNDSDSPVRFSVSDFGTGTVDGEPEGKKYLATNDASVIPGGRALCTLEVLNGETYRSEPFSTIRMESVVGGNNRYSERIPVNLSMVNDKVRMTAEEPYYPDYVLELMKWDQEDQQNLEEETTDTEDILDPLIVATGVYTRKIGNHNDALVTVMVTNLNEKVSIGSLSFYCTVYDADGNAIDSLSAQSEVSSQLKIRPGETVPCLFTTNYFDSGIEAVRAEITIDDYEPLTGTQTDGFLLSNDIFVPSYEITEGVDWEVMTPEHPFDDNAKITGTIENFGEELEYGLMVCVVSDAHGEIIVSDYTVIEDVPSLALIDFSMHFRTAIMELPGYDHADFFVFARQ